MIARILAVFLIFAITYVLWVFIFPQEFDTYGNIGLNAKIREYKNFSLQFASGWENGASLIDTMKSTSQSYIDETQKTYKNIQSTLSGKIQEVQTAVDSVDRAYDAVNQAKSDLNKIIKASTWTTTP